MVKQTQLSSNRFEVHENKSGDWRINLKGRIDSNQTGRLLRDLDALIERVRPKVLRINLEDVSYFDDFGALALVKLNQKMIESNGRFEIIRSGPDTQRILDLVSFYSHQQCALPPTPQRTPNMIIRLGEGTLRHLYNVRFYLAFLGEIVLGMAYFLRHPQRLRWGDTVAFMEKVGVDAVPIVGLISYLLGLIIAFMSSLQLQQFGANIYVASLVGLAMVSELGPIMTAIVVAGRSGSAFAAEISAMNVSEEVDALFSMGFDPVLFLALPRLFAALLVVPVLTLFADFFAIAGGLTVGVTILGLTPGAYIGQTLETLKLSDVAWGFSKSLIFAFIIAWVGCMKGFHARGGASAVGGAATSAVVGSIFFIILSDSVFAIIRAYW